MRGLLVAQLFLSTLIIPLIVIGISFFVNQKRGTKLLLCWPLLVQVLYSVYIGGDAWEHWGVANRFVTIALPAFFICVVWCLSDIIQVLCNQLPRLRRTLVCLGVLILSLCVLTTNRVYEPFPFARLLLFEPPFYTIENMRAVQRARYIEMVTTKDAQIAVVQAGTLPYFLKRQTIDILGKNDRVIAHLPMRFLPELPPILAFYPGHMKWDYSYSIGILQPDVIEGLWSYQEEAEPFIRAGYKVIGDRDILIYVRRNSTHVQHMNLGD